MYNGNDTDSDRIAYNNRRGGLTPGKPNTAVYNRKNEDKVTEIAMYKAIFRRTLSFNIYPMMPKPEKPLCKYSGANDISDDLMSATK